MLNPKLRSPLFLDSTTCNPRHLINSSCIGTSPVLPPCPVGSHTAPMPGAHGQPATNWNHPSIGNRSAMSPCLFACTITLQLHWCPASPDFVCHPTSCFSQLSCQIRCPHHVSVSITKFTGTGRVLLSMHLYSTFE